MRNYGSALTVERELDMLINDLNESMHNVRNRSAAKGSHNSRYYDVYENNTYVHEKTSRPSTPKSTRFEAVDRSKSASSSYYETSNSMSKSESKKFLGSSNSIEERSSPHRDYLYQKYGKFGGTWEPRMPKRNTLEDGWYRSISKEMGTPRSPSPRRNFGSRNLTIHQEYNSAIGRPVSALSRSSGGSAYSSRAGSPILKTRGNHSRSVSPKNVVIGPVTEMIETKRELERHGQQEYFRGRDSRHGKPLSGKHGFMNYSWPYGLNHIGDAYEDPNLRLPHQSPPESKVPYVPPQPLHRRAKSVEPIAMRKIPQLSSRSANSTPFPEHVHGLKHIVVEQVPVPVPPRFGTLTYGGRYPNSAAAPYVDGPPCELCHKPITEGRCIYAENAQYHCWHFFCSFCSKTLKEQDFVMAEDNKPYCVNCFKRMYP